MRVKFIETITIKVEREDRKRHGVISTEECHSSRELSARFEELGEVLTEIVGRLRLELDKER